ncbi:MAG TPA: quinate 5-dehydrogenase [Firmicutes bacterium]|nr:quinate 5-dehydrogenase [Bacillota bacterium]
MKHVVSVSLGSSSRDHVAEVDILGERFRIERRGTNGDFQKAVQLVRSLDGKVDAFGMGGTDVYLVVGDRRYRLRAGRPLAQAARITPMVDGSGLKNTVQRMTVEYLKAELKYPCKGKTAFVVCAVDAYGLAESLDRVGCRLIMGDLLYTVGINYPLRSMAGLRRAAAVLAPIIAQLPMSMLYPTGETQAKRQPKPPFTAYYQQSDIIAGDWHYIYRRLPDSLPGKVVITNTVTASDVEELRSTGAELLLTTTPEFEGRSFGTNVLEAVFITILGKKPADVRPGDYERLMADMGYRPRVVHLQQPEQTG